MNAPIALMQRTGRWAKRVPWLLGILVVLGSGTAFAASTVNMLCLAPLSGGAAFIGQTHFCPGALAGAHEVNAAGGVLGHKVKIDLTDTQDDPADGVTALNQALSVNNPVAIVGPSSDTAAALDPIINSSNVVGWCLCGTTQLDKMNWPYVYRPSPSDGLLGAAMGMGAYKEGYRKAAFVFMSDIGSQTLVGPAKGTFEALGGKVVINLKITPDQPNYRSEVAKVLAQHPDVLVGEMDPQTAATFLTDMKQLNNGKVIPLVESDAGASSDFYKTVSKAIGATATANDTMALQVAGAINSVAYHRFLAALKAVKPNMQPQEFKTNGYDAVSLSALAMAEANSTDPTVWNQDVTSLTNGNGPVVHTYAAGLKAIKDGQKPHYVGASGAITFNQYHNSSGNFWVIKFNTKGVYHETKQLTPKELEPYLKFG